MYNAPSCITPAFYYGFFEKVRITDVVFFLLTL